ncbi:hypothetical protein [Marinobacter sp.]|jgi:hypothetical protein|uniref:hypothetical protein n=1 Tax=Marinobacter sp. TaxID=50741 RepID=UPI003B527C54
MHTLMIILGGFALLVVAIIVARATGRSFKSVLPLYLVAWFLCAAVNMGVGILHAGYSFMAELPIFLFVFGVPALTAVIIARKL